MARSADGQKCRCRCVLLSLTAFTVMSSSFSVLGFFTLNSHNCHLDNFTQAKGKPGTTYHLFYKSDVLCGKYKSMPAVIRKYSPPGDALSPRYTRARD